VPDPILLVTTLTRDQIKRHRDERKHEHEQSNHDVQASGSLLCGLAYIRSHVLSLFLVFEEIAFLRILSPLAQEFMLQRHLETPWF
jgi:hypothetical protein